MQVTFLDNSANGVHCLGASSPVVRHNDFQGTTAFAHQFGAMKCGNGSSPLVEGNTFRGTYVAVTCHEATPQIRDNVIDGGVQGIDADNFANIVVENNLITGQSNFGLRVSSATGTIRGNTIAGTGMYGIRTFRAESGLVADHNIITGWQYGIYRFLGESINTSCNDVWGCAIADFQGQTASTGDFSHDPIFCNPGAGIYTLSASSPCLPDSSPGTCGLVGALGQGCGTSTSVPGLLQEPASWGSVKSRYR